MRKGSGHYGARISTRLSGDEDLAFRDLASQRGISPSALLREAVQQLLADGTDANEAAGWRRAGGMKVRPIPLGSLSEGFGDTAVRPHP